MNTGVYLLKNIVNGKIYIGSASISLHRRINNHLSSLRRGNHRNSHIQSAWNFYGEENFVFSVLEFCSPENCLIVEQKYISSLNACDKNFGYNISPTASSPRGTKHTDQSRKNMSNGAKNKKKNIGFSDTMRRVMKGRKHSEETKRKISESMKKRLFEDKKLYEKRVTHLISIANMGGIAKHTKKNI